MQLFLCPFIAFGHNQAIFAKTFSTIQICLKIISPLAGAGYLSEKTSAFTSKGPGVNSVSDKPFFSRGCLNMHHSVSSPNHASIIISYKLILINYKVTLQFSKTTYT